MKINIDDIMDAMIENMDNSINEFIEEDINLLKENGIFCDKSYEDLVNSYIGNKPILANTVRGLIVLSTATAIGEYHCQLREKFLEFNIDIGDIEINSKTNH